MKRILLVALALHTMLAVPAQKAMERGLQTINQATAEAHIGFLADDALAGREAGRTGGRVAARYLEAQLRQLGIAPLLTHYTQPFEALHCERQRRGRWEIHPDSLAQLRTGVHQRRAMQNVLGIIPGRRTDEYVVVGAHFDHLGTDPLLAGDNIYNGADDNASGVSAVLQIARAFKASGQQPERNVIFAFWDGEELGMLGSRYFVEQWPHTSQIRGYLNFDMIGRNKYPDRPRHVVYFYTEAHPAFGEWLKQDIARYNLKLEPDYRPWDKPTGGSDNGSFAARGIPIIWYHTDGHPDYHLPTDHTERINWEKLVDITKASFLNVWKLANEPVY